MTEQSVGRAIVKLFSRSSGSITQGSDVSDGLFGRPGQNENIAEMFVVLTSYSTCYHVQGMGECNALPYRMTGKCVRI